MIDALNFSGKNKLPITLQTEAAECGLVCLEMIARFYGHKIDVNSLRQQYSISLKGATLENLINISGKLDLGARAVKAELESLRNIVTPAILHWDLNHFVVLKKITRNKIYIHDPAYGLKVLSFSEASPHFTGVVLELLPTNKFRKQVNFNKTKLSDLWARIIGWKQAFAQLFILSVILQIINLISPFYLQLVVDEALIKFDFDLLVVLTFGFLGVTIIQVVTSFMRSWTVLYFGNQLSFQMVANIFKHLMYLPVEYFEKRHIGDILSRLGSTGPIQSALTESIIEGILDSLVAIITGVVIFLYSPFLGSIVLLSIVINFLITLSFYPTLRRTQEEIIVASAKENTHSIESIRASTTIKLFSAQDQRLSIWRNLFANTINTGIAHGKYEIYLGAFHNLIGGLQSILIVYFAAKLILQDGSTFTIGMLFAFMSYRGMFTSGVVSLLGKVIEFRLLGLHLERIADIVQTESEEINSAELNIDNDSYEGKIQLNNVSFRYSESDPWILEDVDLEINSGEFVSIYGASGSGKTTLLKILLGLYAPTKGEVLMDGIPLTDVSKEAWRKNIAVVMQNDQLLSGSLLDNISFFDSHADLARVYQASKLAMIDEEIMSMPMNYLSLVGDMGSALSGGQKQRLLLARAFYRNPKVLFLDEGTVNLDKSSESKIISVIGRLDITRIVVTHSPDFIDSTSRKIFVGNRKIIESY